MGTEEVREASQSRDAAIHLGHAVLAGCYVQEMRGPLPGCETSECRQQRASETKDQLANAVDEYHRVNGEFPPALTALTGGVPVDPWGNPYRLVRVGQHAVVISLGHGGARGGVGADEDLWLVVLGPLERAMQR